MDNHLEYKENRVVISDELRKQPLFIKLYEKDRSQNKKVFYDFITYLYFVYWKKSIYRGQLPETRKILVCREQLKQSDDQIVETITKYEDGLFQQIANWYVDHTKNEEERMLDGVLVKIEEYLKYANDFKIDKDNRAEYIELIKGSNTLLDYRDKIEQRVFKEAKKKGQSGTKSTFLEDKLSVNKLNNE